MNLRLQIGLISGILIFASFLCYFLIKKKLNLRYALLWIAAVVILFLAAICPEMISWFAELFGITTPSNFIFVVFGFIMLLIIFSLTGIVSHMNSRIFRLVQIQAIMEKRIRDLEVELHTKAEEVDNGTSV